MIPQKSRARLLLGAWLLVAAPFAGAQGTVAGSGFFITPDGYFVTTREVVGDATGVMIHDLRGAQFPARLVRADAANGLVLLKAEGSFAALPLVRSGTVRQGDRVLAPGAPGIGGQAGVTPMAEGTVTGLTGSDDGPNAFRVAVPLRPGSAGAPLLSAEGNVVAVLRDGPAGAGANGSRPTGPAYAVKSNYLFELLDVEPGLQGSLLPPRPPAGATSALWIEELGQSLGLIVLLPVDGPAPPVGPGLDPAEATLPAAEMAENGRRALRARDYAGAHKWLRGAAERGDAAAQTALGSLYESGQGVARNDADALRWYASAAEQGNGEAQARLGLMYAQGRGVARNDAEAVSWFRRSAEQGNALGQGYLGAMYLEGLGVYRDEEQALRWLRQAALQGDLAAQNTLGVMFQQGRGVERDPAEAAWWYRKAAEQGNADAQTNLALMYAQGRGVAGDSAEAANWFREAAEQGNPLAQYYLGVSYAEGRGVYPDPMEAVKWMRKAAAQGVPEAQAYLDALRR